MNEASFSLYDCIRKYTAYTKVISNADTVMIALLPGSRINLDKTTNIDPFGVSSEDCTHEGVMSRIS